MVTPESLNRLVASAADDSSIIGICGETKLHNEEGSWWTMIQVYEYYISHNLSKIFDFLFGSVTSLSGCFSLYRIRATDKGRSIIISNRIMDEYAETNVDMVPKKKLFLPQRGSLFDDVAVEALPDVTRPSSVAMRSVGL